MVLGQQNAVLLAAQEFQGRRLKIRGDDNLAEQGVQGLGRGEIEGAVGDYHAAECGDRIARERVGIGLGERIAGGQSTSVVVLEDRDGRRIVLELGHELDGGVHIEQVVVAERLAVVLGEQAFEVSVVGAGLVGVFAVAKWGAGRFEQGQHFGLSALADPGADGGIVTGGDTKGGSSHAPAEVEVGAHAIAERIDEVGVLAARRDADHVGEVLGRSANEGDATDVDFFDDLPFFSAGSQRLLEGVEVHDDQVDGANAMLGDIGIVRAESTAGQDAAKDHGVQRLYASTQHFSRIGDALDRGHLGAEGFDGLLRPARGQDLHTVGMQLLDDGGKALLVEDGNQGALDGALHGVRGIEGREIRPQAKPPPPPAVALGTCRAGCSWKASSKHGNRWSPTGCARCCPCSGS